MNYSIFRIPLNLHSVQSQASVPVFLGDTSIQLRISLSDGVKPYMITDGCLAKISIKRPTGTHLEEFCSIENNTTIVYSFDQNEHTAAVEGIHDCDVTLYGKDGGVLGSPRFTMVVSEKVVNSDDIVISEDDHNTIDAIIKAEVSRQDAETGRINNEAERVDAETKRAQAEEQRALVEGARVEAEKSREANASKLEEAITLANDAAKQANEAAAKVDGVINGEFLTASDIIDNLETSASNKPLSAKQGVELKGMIDELLENGVPGEGTPGESGKDGVSVTHSWEGTVLTLTSASGTTQTDLKGEPGKDGKDGADGKDGEDGYTPIKGVDYFDGANGRDGVDGATPTIMNGYWYVNGNNTNVKAAGTDGKDGANGKDGTNGKDGVNGEDGKDGANGKDGADGKTPYIQNGYWYIDGVNQNVKAVGTDGKDGKDGTNGTDGKNGYTPIKGVDYFDGINGTNGKDGKDGYTPIKGVDYFDGTDGADGRTPMFDVFDGDELYVSYDGCVNWSIVGILPKGEDGQDGVGVSSILKTSTNGLVDTYTITLTNGQTYHLPVTNGKDGQDGITANHIIKQYPKNGRFTIEVGKRYKIAKTVKNATQWGFTPHVTFSIGPIHYSCNVVLPDCSKYDDYLTFRLLDVMRDNQNNTIIVMDLNGELQEYNTNLGSDNQNTSCKIEYANIQGASACYLINEEASIDFEYLDERVMVQIKPEFAQSVADMTDTSKLYVYEGNIWAYVFKEGSIVKNYINRIPSSTDKNGEVYGDDHDGDGVNDGYRENVRLSSDGYSERDNPTDTTGLIACTTADTLYFANCQIAVLGGSSTTYQAIACFDSNKTIVGTRYVDITTQMSGKDYSVDSNNYLTRYNCADLWANTAFVRITGNYIGEDSIITVNQKIEDTVTEGGYQWANTGYAFVPADYEKRIIAAENLLLVHEGRIADLEKGGTQGGTVVTDNVPDYVKAEAKEVADKIIANRTANSLVLLMATDIHWIASEHENFANNRTAVKHLGMGMAEIRKQTRPDAVVLLGDYVYNVTPLDKSQAIKAMKGVVEKMHDATNGITSIWLDGNHDYYEYDEADKNYRLTDGEHYALVGANNSPDVEVDVDNLKRNYGYIDFKKQRVRLIYLNTTDISENVYSANYITNTQGQWLINTALNMSDKADADKWGIVVCSHFPIYASPFTDLKAVLGAYKDKSSGTNYGVSYDFTNAKAELIATFHGHIHNFKVTDVATSGGNTIKAICVPNSCPDRENPYTGDFQETDASGNAVSYPKTADTAADTSFNAVTIDRDNEIIYAHCYGAGIDREISY